MKRFWITAGILAAGALLLSDIWSVEFSAEEKQIPVYSRDFDSMTLSEFELIAKCVMAEAGGEDFEVQNACAEVILNRVDGEEFPDDIGSVIRQKGEFTAWKNGMIQRAVPTDSVYEAVQLAIEEKYFPDNVYYFSSEGYFEWASPYRKIGKMYFSRQQEGH